MKKRTFKFIGGLSLMLVTIVSCQKENVQPTASVTGKASGTTKTFTNPYNFIGIAHNDALIPAITSSDYQSANTANKLLWLEGKIENSFTNNGASSYAVYNLAEKITSTQTSEILDDSFDPETYFDGKMSLLNSYESAAISTMDGLFDTYTSNRDWSAFQSGILTLETNVDASTNLTLNSKKMVLATIAAGKSSFSFWTGHESTAPPSSFRIKPWLADVGGFFGGAWAAWQNGSTVSESVSTGVELGGFASEVAALLKD